MWPEQAICKGAVTPYDFHKIFHQIFRPVFSSHSLSTIIVPCDHLSRKSKAKYESEVRPIFNRLSGENRDVTMTFPRTIIILNEFIN